VPGEQEAAGDAGSVRPVALAQGCAFAVGLLVIGAAGAVATLFGFGWATFTLAAALPSGAYLSWDGSFYRRVRFARDDVSSERLAQSMHEARAIELVSVK